MYGWRCEYGWRCDMSMGGICMGKVQVWVEMRVGGGMSMNGM